MPATLGARGLAWLFIAPDDTPWGYIVKRLMCRGPPGCLTLDLTCGGPAPVVGSGVSEGHHGHARDGRRWAAQRALVERR
jgi:hypothetical protein